MAQIARAVRGALEPVAPPRSLFANAIATSIRGFLSSIRASQEPGRIVLRPSQFNRVIAPMIKRRRMSACPAFEIRPSRVLPPDECCRGTRPSQAEKSRPRLKQSMDGAKASIASAVNGPTPGIVCSRRVKSASFDRILAFFVLTSIRSVFSEICKMRSRHSSSASSGSPPFGSSRGASIRLRWRCCTKAVEDSLRESRRLVRRHAEARFSPLSNNELVQLSSY